MPIKCVHCKNLLKLLQQIFFKFYYVYVTGCFRVLQEECHQEEVPYDIDWCSSSTHGMCRITRRGFIRDFHHSRCYAQVYLDQKNFHFRAWFIRYMTVITIITL